MTVLDARTEEKVRAAADECRTALKSMGPDAGWYVRSMTERQYRTKAYRAVAGAKREDPALDVKAAVARVVELFGGDVA
jgi:hypothetical protein